LVELNHLSGITVVTLNRSQALNALSNPLRNTISATFDKLANDESTEVIILTGAGRAFTVGLDLKELGGEVSQTEKPLSRDIEISMREVGKPIIGAVNGFAITGGFEMALMCDFLVATPSAKFADTHARVGVVPGWGLSQKLPRLIGINRAKELSLTGNFLDAKTALDWGLVNRVVDPEILIPTCIELANDILSTDKVTRTEIRKIMDAGWLSTLEAGLDKEKEANRAHNRKHRPDDKVASRRNDIQARGRAQTTNSHQDYANRLNKQHLAPSKPG